MEIDSSPFNRCNVCFRSMALAMLTVMLLVGLSAAAPAEQTATPPSTNSPLTSLHQGMHLSEHLYNLPGLSNVGRVAPGVFRGAQPAVYGYAALKKMGVKTVIDLRTTENEKAMVEAAGMKAIAMPITMSREGLKEKVDRVIA